MMPTTMVAVVPDEGRDNVGCRRRRRRARRSAAIGVGHSSRWHQQHHGGRNNCPRCEQRPPTEHHDSKALNCLEKPGAARQIRFCQQRKCSPLLLLGWL